jgi:hypothetical protein
VLELPFSLRRAAPARPRLYHLRGSGVNDVARVERLHQATHCVRLHTTFKKMIYLRDAFCLDVTSNVELFLEGEEAAIELTRPRY